MKAISTRYIGATTRLPARILATDQDGNRITLSAYDTGDEQFPYDRAHRAAAEALCRKMAWSGAETLIGGSVKNGQVWVFPPSPHAGAGRIVTDATQGRVCASCGESPCLESCGACDYEAPTSER